MSASATYRMMRAAAGLTVEDAADLVGVSVRTFQRWEAAPEVGVPGDAPKRDVLETLEDAVSLTLTYADEMTEMTHAVLDKIGGVPESSIGVIFPRPRAASDIKTMAPAWMGGYDAAVAHTIAQLLDEEYGVSEFRSAWRGDTVDFTDFSPSPDKRATYPPFGLTVLGAATCAGAYEDSYLPIVAFLEQPSRRHFQRLTSLTAEERHAVGIEEEPLITSWDSGDLRDDG